MSFSKTSLRVSCFFLASMVSLTSVEAEAGILPSGGSSDVSSSGGNTLPSFPQDGLGQQPYVSSPDPVYAWLAQQGLTIMNNFYNSTQIYTNYSPYGGSVLDFVPGYTNYAPYGNYGILGQQCMGYLNGYGYQMC